MENRDWEGKQEEIEGKGGVGKEGRMGVDEGMIGEGMGGGEILDGEYEGLGKIRTTGPADFSSSILLLYLMK
jgi:hypothetical protein